MDEGEAIFWASLLLSLSAVCLTMVPVDPAGSLARLLASAIMASLAVYRAGWGEPRPATALALSALAVAMVAAAVGEPRVAPAAVAVDATEVAAACRFALWSSLRAADAARAELAEVFRGLAENAVVAG